MKYNLNSSEIIRVVTVQVFSNQTKTFRQKTVKQYVNSFSRTTELSWRGYLRARDLESYADGSVSS
jgi:hypothetical protein